MICIDIVGIMTVSRFKAFYKHTSFLQYKSKTKNFANINLIVYKLFVYSFSLAATTTNK